MAPSCCTGFTWWKLIDRERHLLRPSTICLSRGPLDFEDASSNIPYSASISMICVLDPSWRRVNIFLRCLNDEDDVSLRRRLDLYCSSRSIKTLLGFLSLGTPCTLFGCIDASNIPIIWIIAIFDLVLDHNSHRPLLDVAFVEVITNDLQMQAVPL